ncbi:MAG: DUF2240 family protein [Methanobacteriota archaeon]
MESAIAAVFKAKGLASVPEKEFVMFVSMTKRWLTPAEGQRLLEVGLAAKLLERRGADVKPTFDPAAVNIPANFAPDKNVLAHSQPEGLFPVIVRKIGDATKLGRREVVAMINRRQEEANVEIEVAAMLVAAEHGIAIAEYVGQARAEILDRYKD